MENIKDFATQIIEETYEDYPEQQATHEDMEKAVKIVEQQNKITKVIEGDKALALTNYDNKLIASRLNALDLIGDTIKNALKPGINLDYATIPGTNKPTLLQPGARKICMMYGLVAQYSQPIINGDNIMMNCKLIAPNGMVISESYGATTIQKTNRDSGFELNRAIKMCQKRAFVGATLNVANLSKLFTQDMEDTQEAQNMKPKYIQHSSEEWEGIRKALQEYVELKHNAKVSKFTWKKYFVEFSKLFNEFKSKNERFKDKADIFDILKDNDLAMLFKQYWLGLSNEAN